MKDLVPVEQELAGCSTDAVGRQAMSSPLVEHVQRYIAALKGCNRALPADLPEFARSLYRSSDQEQARLARRQSILREMKAARELIGAVLEGE